MKRKRKPNARGLIRDLPQVRTVMRAELLKRQRTIGAERDRLREIARDCEELAEACEDAHEALGTAIEALSRYA